MTALRASFDISGGGQHLKQTSKTQSIILALVFYIPVVWAALLVAQCLGGGLLELLSRLTEAMESPLDIRWTENSAMAVLAATGIYIAALSIRAAELGNRRDGEEHGSAVWGSPRQVNAMFCQKGGNKPLTRNVRLGLDSHKHRRSLNVLVIGGSGAAKTRGYVLPNILEANTNYVITDPKMGATRS